MNVLVIGGSGFLGWNAVRHFAGRGHDVTATFHESLPHYLHLIPDCQPVRLDVRDGTAIDEIVGRVQPEICLHLAATARPQLQTDPDELRCVNVEATEHVARACAARNVLLVFVSTDLVYPPDAGRCDESTPVASRPANAYAASKIEAEHRLRRIAGRWIIIRSSLLFGVGPPGSNAFTQFLDREWEAGRAAPVFTDQFRSFLYVGDLVAAMDLLVRRQRDLNRLYVCGGGEELSRYEFALRYARARSVDPAMCRAMRSEELAGYRGGPSRIVLDSARLHAAGWRPRSLPDAFAEMQAIRERNGGPA